MKGIRGFAGVCLVGYGALVLLRVIAHEALVAGLASLTLGASLLAWMAWETWNEQDPRIAAGHHAAPPPTPPTGDAPGSPPTASHADRAPWIAGLGAAIVAGLVGYNALVGSGLATPEWGLVGYGVALIAAAPLLASPRYGDRAASIVGWSFPLLFTPLALYAVHALISGPAGLGTADAAAPLIHYTLTLPTAGVLDLLGAATHVAGNNILLETPRGTLALGVGLVCAGIYPIVLFTGILAMHAWREGLAPRRLTGYLAVGLVGLYLANLLRLVLLARIGQAWGGVTLQQAHAHLGWILFVGFMLAFWGLVLRRWERDPQPRRAG